MDDLNWHRLTPRFVGENPEILALMASFEPLDHPAGHAAARFLLEDALINHGSTVTHVFLGPERIEGFVAMTFGDIKLSEAQSSELGILHRRGLPAFRLAWIAKHRDTDVPGMSLVFYAYTMAIKALLLGGVAALSLDPYDAEAAATWLGAPYEFRTSNEKPRRDGVPRGLWLPVRRDDDYSSKS